MARPSGLLARYSCRPRFVVARCSRSRTDENRRCPGSIAARRAHAEAHRRNRIDMAKPANEMTSAAVEAPRAPLFGVFSVPPRLRASGQSVLFIAAMAIMPFAYVAYTGQIWED